MSAWLRWASSLTILSLLLSQSVVQSPKLVYATYLGGKHKDCATAIAVDRDGSAYVVGRTPSPDFPVTGGAFRRTASVQNNDWTGFLSKLDSSGTRLIYSTFLGGNFRASANSVVVDGAQRALVGGSTCASDLRTTPTALLRTPAGSDRPNACDGFVLLMNRSGSRPEFASYVGGSGEDAVTAVAINASGSQIYGSGYTDSSDLNITETAAQQTPGGGRDGFLHVISIPSGRLLYSTYLGGSGNETVTTIRLTPNGQVLIAGTTTSPGWPYASGRQRLGKGGNVDSFILRIDPGSKSMPAGIILGGGGDDAVSSIDVDAAGDLFATGTTNSADFPTRGPFSGRQGSGFVARIAGAAGQPSNWSLRWSRKIRGSREDALLAISAGFGGSLFIAGRSSSADFPTTANAIHRRLLAQNDSILLGLRANDGNIEYASFVGGTQIQNVSWYNDEATSLNATPSGDVFLTGCTLGGRLRVSSYAFQRRPPGNSDPFVLRLQFQKTGGS